MSNLFKSKILLGVFAMVLALGVATSALAADGAVTKTLRQGMRDTQVKYLQQTLNEKGFTVATAGRAGSAGMETTYFGTATAVAVKAFQAAKGLVTDGIFGPASRSALVASGSVSGNFPAGCQSAAGYSPTTGVSCATGVSNAPVATGSVTVALSADTPASGSVVSPSTGAVFAKYLFTGNGTVTSLKLMRTGISANTALTNIYLYDGAVRLTDAASLNSDNTATFNATNGLFTVTGSKVISVVADVAGSDYSVGLTLVSVTSGGVVTPMSLAGNIQYVAVVASPATVAFGAVTPSGGTTDPAKDVVVFQSSVNIGTRDVQFTRLAMRNIGSVNTADIANFRLLVDGATVATVAGMDINGYVTFVLATPKTLTTGTRVFKVLADVNGGSSRTFQFSIRNKTDVGFLDTQYNAGIGATGIPATPTTATTINPGTATVQKASDSPSGNTILNGSDVVLARYTLTTYGESLKIEQIKAGFTYTNVGGGNGGGATLRNGRIMINGAQVGSTATLVPAGTTYTTNYVLNAGTPTTLEIRADIYDNDGTGAIVATDTIVGILKLLASNTQKLSSLGYISVPSADMNGNTLTAASAASITLAKTATYANQTTAVPQTSSYKLGSFTLNGNNVEDVNLDTVAVNFTNVAVAANDFTAADLTDVILKIDGAVIGSPKGTVSATGDTYSISKVLAKNGTMTLEIWGNIGSTITAAEKIMTEMTVSGVGALSSVASSTAAMVDGQVITANTGSITVTLDASRPDAAINDDSGTKTMAAFKFAAVTDSYTVTELTLTVADITTTSAMSLYDGATLIATKAAAATTNFYGLSWPIPAGTSKVLTVKLDLGTVGVGAGSTGASTLVTLTAGMATNGAGVSAAITESDPAGTAQYTYKAIPTVTNVALPSTVLSAGTATLAKFTVGTNGTGTVGWNRMVFNIAKTSNPTLASFELWNADSNTQIAGTSTIVDTANAATCLNLLLACRVSFVPTAEQQISGAVTYVLKATVGGALATNDYVSTNMLAPSSFAASAAYATVAASGGYALTYAGFGTTPSFIWSDVSASSHGTGTLDWSNDYKVRNFPTDSQTVTK